MRALTLFMRTPWVRNGLCRLASSYIRLVWASGRWRVIGAEIPEGYWDAGQPFILAFWHGRLLMTPRCWRRGQSMNMLTSQHPDGDFIARTIGHFGLRAVRGSTAKSGKRAKGGGSAFRLMIRKLALGECAGITPDGPRGPRMRAADGIISLARLAGAPVIPVTYSASLRIHAKSWDRFLIALPFTRGVILWGDAIHVPAAADAQMREQARQMLEDTLNRITCEADMMCGHQPVEPAPLIA